MASIETLAWVLPRPRKNYYPGGFPLWFEQKLIKLYGNPEKILHPFGGAAEFGMRLDIKVETQPDVIGDAHHLPFADDSFDLVICDPPYSNELSERIYGTGKIVYKRWVSEAVRVCKPSGFVVVYHFKMLPRPEGTKYHRRIFLGVRVWHHLRCVGIFKKETDGELQVSQFLKAFGSLFAVSENYSLKYERLRGKLRLRLMHNREALQEMWLSEDVVMQSGNVDRMARNVKHLLLGKEVAHRISSISAL